MADTSHRNRWLLNAEDACGVDQTAAQIIWLRAKRAEYAALVDAGDWETQSASGEAGSSSSRRGVSDQANHDAIMAALRYLGATDIGGGGVLTPQFSGILS
jgi:hypothetical protein